MSRISAFMNYLFSMYCTVILELCVCVFTVKSNGEIIQVGCMIGNLVYGEFVGLTSAFRIHVPLYSCFLCLSLEMITVLFFISR